MYMWSASFHSFVYHYRAIIDWAEISRCSLEEVSQVPRDLRDSWRRTEKLGHEDCTSGHREHDFGHESRGWVENCETWIILRRLQREVMGSQNIQLSPMYHQPGYPSLQRWMKLHPKSSQSDHPTPTFLSVPSTLTPPSSPPDNQAEQSQHPPRSPYTSSPHPTPERPHPSSHQPNPVSTSWSLP